MTGLAGRIVVITGAASGIGRAAAVRFAGEGARVVVADLDADGAAAVVGEIAAAGGTAVAVTGDLSEQAVVDRVVSTAVDTFGGLDVLVNNAGILDRMSAAADVADAEWERVLRVNLTAPFQLTRAAGPRHRGARGVPGQHRPDRGRGRAGRGDRVPRLGRRKQRQRRRPAGRQRLVGGVARAYQVTGSRYTP
jgi:NAD(P)-dependent dehydrogenase (short-subunit alcohol dehydrogenase family)